MPGIFLAFCAICQRTRHKMCSESDISRSADSVASCPAGTVRVGPGVLWPVSSRPPEGRELAGPYTVAPPGRALPLRAPRRRAVPPRPSPGRALPLQSPTPLHARPGPATSCSPPQLRPHTHTHTPNFEEQTNYFIKIITLYESICKAWLQITNRSLATK